MLVLSRNKEQSILIGEGISVVVLEIQGNRVRLGIQAPDDTRILRQECVEGEPKEWQGEFALSH